VFDGIECFHNPTRIRLSEPYGVAGKADQRVSRKPGEGRFANTMNSKKIPRISRMGADIPISGNDHARDVYRIRDSQKGYSETLGLREQNKIDKLHRIYVAARRNFADVGYEATTLRDIAKEARVALGTLSFYAENKRELVLLIFNQTMPGIVENCQRAGIYEGSLVDAVIAYFRPVYAAYAKELDLFRTLLRENVFHTASPHAREFRRIRLGTIAHLRSLIFQARDSGEIRPHIDIDLTARTIFFLFFAAVRWWIFLDRPAVEPGLAELRSMIALLLDGMKSETAEPALAVRRRTIRKRRQHKLPSA
jgi:AcrR family transcriptional regulator